MGNTQNSEQEETFEEKRDRLVLENMEAMKQNAAMQEYFKQFSESSVQRFMESYAKEKVNWQLKQKVYAEIDSDEAKEITELAWLMLTLVQFRKILTLEARWRAQLIHFERINTTSNFERLYENAFSNLVSPISEAEFSLVQKYVRGEAIKDFFPTHNTSYTYKNAISPTKPEYFSDTYPIFYSMYDKAFNDGGIIGLPDLRGAVEEKYFQAWKNAQPEDLKMKELMEDIKKPKLHCYWDENLTHTEYYIKNFEKEENQPALLQALKANKWAIAFEKTPIYFNAIKRREIPVALTEETDISIAISKANIQSKLFAVDQLLPEIYQEYLKWVANGSYIPTYFNFYLDDHFTSYGYAELTKGREILGLPFDGYI